MNEEPLSRKKLLAVYAPFLVLLVFTGAQYLPTPPQVAVRYVVIAILGLLLVALVAGLVQGLPRWALPAFGFALFVFNYFLDGGTGRLVRWLGLRVYWPPELGLRKIEMALTQSLVYMLPSLFVLLFLLAVSILFSRLSPFSRLLRRDWSILAFILYGWSLLLTLFYDAYRHLAPYEVAASLILLGGAWLYLRQPSPGRRWMALVAAMALQALVLGLGIYLIFPLESFGSQGYSQDRVWEALQPLLWDGLIICLMTLTAALALLPSEQPLVTE